MKKFLNEQQHQKKLGFGLIAFSCLLAVCAFIIKQQTINMDSPADAYAKKFGTTVYAAEAQVARFGGGKEREAEANEIIRKGIIEEAKEEIFPILIGITAVTFLSGIIMISGTQKDESTATCQIKSRLIHINRQRL